MWLKKTCTVSWSTSLLDAKKKVDSGSFRHQLTLHLFSTVDSSGPHRAHGHGYKSARGASLHIWAPTASSRATAAWITEQPYRAGSNPDGRDSNLPLSWSRGRAPLWRARYLDRVTRRSWCTVWTIASRASSGRCTSWSSRTICWSGRSRSSGGRRSPHPAWRRSTDRSWGGWDAWFRTSLTRSIGLRSSIRIWRRRCPAWGDNTSRRRAADQRRRATSWPWRRTSMTRIGLNCCWTRKLSPSWMSSTSWRETMRPTCRRCLDKSRICRGMWRRTDLAHLASLRHSGTSERSWKVMLCPRSGRWEKLSDPSLQD